MHRFPNKTMTHNLAPTVMPAATAQNKKIKSIGSFIAVRNRTMDKAPTIPKDSVMFDEIVAMIIAEMIVIIAMATLKLWL